MSPSKLGGDQFSFFLYILANMCGCIGNAYFLLISDVFALLRENFVWHSSRCGMNNTEFGGDQFIFGNIHSNIRAAVANAYFYLPVMFPHC